LHKKVTESFKEERKPDVKTIPRVEKKLIIEVSQELKFKL